MTDILVVTCPECGFEITEKVTGRAARTRTIIPANWLMRCTADVPAVQDCPFLQAEADAAVNSDPPLGTPEGAGR